MTRDSRLAPEEDSEYAATRYIPALKSILVALTTNQLSMTEYPSVTPMPTPSAVPAAGRTSVRASKSGAAASARKSAGASSKWSGNSGGGGAGNRSSGPVNYTGPRNLVFVIGGLCYPEMRAAREVMEIESREVIMGSTAFLSANEFVEDLTKLASQIH